MVNINGIRLRLDDIVSYTLYKKTEPTLVLYLNINGTFRTCSITFNSVDIAEEVLDYLDNYFRTFRVLD